MINQIKIYSKRMDQEYNAVVYEKDGNLIIKHTSLESIYWSIADKDRPKFSCQILNLAALPGIPPMFAVKGIFEGDNLYMDHIGEMLCMDWEKADPIKKSFPLTTCRNITFDRLFIRYMQFQVKGYELSAFYSSSEFSLDGCINLSDKQITSSEKTCHEESPMSYAQDFSSTIHQESYTDNTEETQSITPNLQSTTLPDQLALNGQIEETANPTPQEYYTNDSQSSLPNPEVNRRMEDLKTTSKETEARVAADKAILENVFGDPVPDLAGVPNPNESWFMDNPTDYPFDDGFISDDVLPFQPDKSNTQSPFPWGNNPMPPTLDIPELEPMPAPLNIPDYENSYSSMSTQSESVNTSSQTLSNGSKKVLNVIRVQFDLNIGKSIVTTDAGIFHYDPYGNTWIAEGIDLQTIDLDDLYKKTSVFVGQQLKDFNGMMIP